LAIFSPPLFRGSAFRNSSGSGFFGQKLRLSQYEKTIFPSHLEVRPSFRKERSPPVRFSPFFDGQLAHFFRNHETFFWDGKADLSVEIVFFLPPFFQIPLKPRFTEIVSPPFFSTRNHLQFFFSSTNMSNALCCERDRSPFPSFFLKFDLRFLFPPCGIHFPWRKLGGRF